LTIETLKGILLELEPNLPDEDLAQIIEEVDEDGSGTIDFDGNCRITVVMELSGRISFFRRELDLSKNSS
jgi:Ca2+-binding EF-hand superfamily protein